MCDADISHCPPTWDGLNLMDGGSLEKIEDDPRKAQREQEAGSIADSRLRSCGIEYYP
jgi:hypothetical protein